MTTATVTAEATEEYEFEGVLVHLDYGSDAYYIDLPFRTPDTLLLEAVSCAVNEGFQVIEDCDADLLDDDRGFRLWLTPTEYDIFETADAG